MGVLSSIDPKKVIKKGRLEPGRMFLIDMDQGRIIGDTELKISTNEDIKKACKHAAAHEFIEKLPDGYDTLIGEMELDCLAVKNKEFLLLEQF